MNGFSKLIRPWKPLRAERHNPKPSVRPLQEISMALIRATQHKTPSHLIWLALGLLLSLSNHAQANGKIYQVEIIVFERNGGALGGGEGWQKNIQLEYPAKWQRLLDPATAQAPSDEFLQTLAQEREQSQRTPVQSSAEPGYFVFLPAARRDLQNSRDALARRNQYRILFHETWLQPMEPIEKALPLILHGGRQYGDYHELQGTLTVGISRFLHVQTDLWLSEFSTDQYQDAAYGIQLPREPRDSSEQAGNDWDVEQTEPHGELAPPAYRVNQVNVLRQKRRMRSGELHYLDHPRVGALIKITPQ